MHRSADARSYSKSMFNFVRNHQLSSQWLHHLASHSHEWASLLLHVLTSIWSRSCCGFSPCAMASHFVMIHDAVCLLTCLFDIRISSLLRCLLRSFILFFSICVLLAKHFLGDKPWNVRAERWAELNGSPGRICNYLTCPSQAVLLILPQMGSKNNCVVSLRLEAGKGLCGDSLDWRTQAWPLADRTMLFHCGCLGPPSTTLCTCPSWPLAGSLSDHADTQNCGSALVPLPLAHWEPQTSHHQSQASSGVSSPINLL